jgi:hypothetical protein
VRLPASCTMCRGELDPLSAVVIWITRLRMWRVTGASTERVRNRYVLCDDCAGAVLFTVDPRGADNQARAVDDAAAREHTEALHNAAREA